MNRNHKSICFLLLLMTLISIVFSSLYAVNKEDNDVVVIIGLYNDKLYDLAELQISLYEHEYKASKYTNTVSLIKANIAFVQKDYVYADSLYNNLLNKAIEQTMRAEILINKASIKYADIDYVEALNLLQQAENITTVKEHKYQIELLRGKVNVRLYRADIAQHSFEQALTYKKGDAETTFELLSLFISNEDNTSAQTLINNTIDNAIALDIYIASIDTWLDYQIAQEEYQTINDFEMRITQKFTKIPDAITLRFAKAHYLNKDYDIALNLISKGTTYQNYRQYLKGLILVQQGQDAAADSIFAVLANQEDAYNNPLPGTTEDIVINSWLERIKLLYKTSPNQALLSMKTYLLDNTEEEINPMVPYVYGSLLFKSKNYQAAAETLLSIPQTDLPADLKQNIQIMLGDIWFDARIFDTAAIAYNKYLNQFPNGKFKVHAIYNIALINFEQKDYPAAIARLNSIISPDNNAEIVEKARFLLAEIDYFQANYTQALLKYQQITPRYLKPTDINFRIAQSLYYLEDYQTALDYINNLVSDSTNAFQILMFSGNIYFNLKQYTTALTAYNQALQHTNKTTEKEEVNSYIALTLYRLGQFKDATALYLKLSKEKESPEAYLIMAAKASYHAKEFQQSLLLFKQFVAEHPLSTYYEYALANIGSIYYNQADYPKAIDAWVNLLKRYQNNTSFSDEEQNILSGVFTGLQWCFKQSPNDAILDELNNSIDSFKSEYIRFEIQYLLLKIYYGDEQWADLLQMADEMRKEFPQKETNDIRLLVAGSLSKLKRYEEADSTYQIIYKIEPTANILTEWADLELLAGKTDTAIDKLNQALTKEKTPQRLIKLLRAVYDYAPDSLGTYWNSWGNLFSPPPAQAQFIMLQWYYDNGNWVLCDSLANGLLLNDELPIRSKAQLYKGISQFKLGNLDAAIIELYKAIYLYPDLSDIVLEAKKYIIKTYLLKSQAPEARAVYDEIIDSLSPEEIAEFDQLFAGQQY